MEYISSPSPTEQDAATQHAACKIVTLVLHVGLLSACCLFGIIGNILSFKFFSTHKRADSQENDLLKLLALVDNLFLLTAGIYYIHNAVVYVTEQTLNAVYAYQQIVLWPLLNIFHMGSLWLTLLVVTRRCCLVRAPSYIQLCNSKLCAVLFAMAITIVI